MNPDQTKMVKVVEGCERHRVPLEKQQPTLLSWSHPLLFNFTSLPVAVLRHHAQARTLVTQACLSSSVLDYLCFRTLPRDEFLSRRHVLHYPPPPLPGDRPPCTPQIRGVLYSIDSNIFIESMFTLLCSLQSPVLGECGVQHAFTS